MATATNLQRLPEIGSRSIYEGKYRDRNPTQIAAGKLTASSDTAELCMKPENLPKRAESPEVVRRFRASLRPGAGKSKIFYGKAGDPHLRWAQNMVHGVNTQPSFTAQTLINPNPISRFKMEMLNKKEGMYASHQRAPLGQSHDQSLGFPPGFDRDIVFGVHTLKDGSAGELVNPDKSVPKVDEDYNAGRHLYKKTHFGYDVGEQKRRNYIHSFDQENRYGIPTPHDNSGKHVKRTMHWIHDQVMEKGTPVVSKRVDDFRERTQPQLGQVHDPIKDTLTVPPDHTFGVLLKPDEYGAGDLLHNRGPKDYLRGKDRIRGVIAAMRQHLKKVNYHNFQDILQAFRFYDKDGSGKIDINELREVCFQFDLPLDVEIVEQVIDYCDIDRDGQISYLEFANFLNWRDMSSGLPPSKSAPPGGRMAPAEPTERPLSSERLARSIDKAHRAVDYRTSASLINAVYGRTNTAGYRSYGVPTIRSDLPAPRIRRICDTQNYGDESDARGLVNPSVYSSYGVYEKDFLLPRSKEEIRQIYVNSGVVFTDQTFDELWAQAAAAHARGHVSVESFRHVLDQTQALALTRGATIC